MKTKALVLAGGLGTRLRPLTNTLPKCMIPIANKALIDYWLDALAAANVTDVRINNHHLPDHLRAHLQRINQLGRLIATEAYEPDLLGSAGTITANRAWADDADAILIIYADNVSNVNLVDLLSYHASHPEPFTMMLFRTLVPKACGIAELDLEKRIIAFVEKPDQPKSNLANAGVYIVDAEAFREIADMNAFDIGFDVVPRFIGRMRGWVFDGYHRDIGTLESLEQAELDAKQYFPECAGQ